MTSSRSLYPLLTLGFLVAALWGASTGQVTAQPDNLSVLQSCARLAADSLIRQFPEGDTICLTLAEHPASWIVDQAVIAVAEPRRNVIQRCAMNSPSATTVAITAIGIDYREIDDPDALARDARLGLDVAFAESVGNAGGRTMRSYSVRLDDTVTAQSIPALEGSGYDFTRGTRNAASGGSGFWSKVVEPAVVIGATAVIVILLFTVRSQ